jgi:exodeoxyribonuclease-5
VISLSEDQKAFVASFCDWFRSAPCGQQTFHLHGYAGTGKTTATGYALEELGLGLRSVAFAAFTMKAALVMRANGLRTASTIHKLIYTPVTPSPFAAEEARAEFEELREQCPDDMPPAVWKARVRQLEQAAADAGRVRFIINPFSDVRDARLVVIDECSMVGQELADDLLAFGKPVLNVGDPGQLPPIRGGERAPFLTSRPDAMLTEIHRQAAESPIIALATKARLGLPIGYGDFGNGVRKVRKGTLDVSAYLDADQVLCGLHQTRRRVNNAMKRAAGYPEPLPTGDGEKIIALKNQHRLGIFNGQFLRLDEVEYRRSGGGRGWRAPDGELSISAAVFSDDGEALGEQEIYAGHFLDHVAYDKDRGWRDQWDKRGLVEADWGWVVTVHKSQGSGWPHVVVIDDGWGRDPQQRKQWLYTAITRAADKLTIIG